MRRTVLLIIWLLTDLVFFVGSYALAYFARVGWILSSDFPFDLFIQTAALVSPLWLAVMLQLGIFRLMRRQLDARNVAHIAFACIVGSSLFTLAYYFLYTDFFSRLLLIYAFLLHTGITIAWHAIFERIMRRTLRAGRPVYPTLIVGATREAAALLKVMRTNASPLVPVAILDGKGAKDAEIEGVPVEGKLNKLEESIAKHGITHLIQCSDLEQSINLLSACRSHGIAYMLLPSVLGIVERDERIETIEGRPVTVVRPPETLWTWFFR